MTNWWESDPIVSEPLRPLVAHAPKSAGNWWESDPIVDSDRGTLDEEPRTPAIGEDPRLAPDAVFNDAQAARVAGSIGTGLGTYSTVATGLGPATGGAVLRVLPYVGGAAMGGREMVKTGDPVRAGAAALEGYFGTKGLVGGGRSLLAKLGAKAAAKAAPATVEAAAAEAPAVARAVAAEAPAVAKLTEAEIESLLIKATDATAPPKVRFAARAALQKAGWTPDMGMVARPIAEEAAPVAAETVAPAARKLAPIPPGKSRMATVYTRPKGLPPQQSEAARTLRSSGSRSLAEKQADLAKSAGMDIGEAFGTAAPKVAQAEQAAESALMTRLRASVMMKKDPVGLVNEVTEKAAELAASGLGREQVAARIEALYGLTPEKVKQLADAVTFAQGLK